MASLQRTIAFTQMHRLALSVAKNLDLDMTWLAQILLDIHFVIAKRGLGFRACGMECRLHFACRLCQLHAPAAAASRSLHDDRVADLLADRDCLIERVHAAFRAWHARYAQALHRVLRGDLVSHKADVFRRRADELKLMIFENLREFRVFRRKP